MRIVPLHVSSIILSVATLLSVNVRAQDYYLSQGGDDVQNSGTSPSSPWRSIGRINGLDLEQGDRIFLRRGETWREQLNITAEDSGAAGNPVIITAYDQGANPVIRPTEPFSEWLEYSSALNGGFEVAGSGGIDAFINWSENIDNSAGPSASIIERTATDVSQGKYAARLFYAPPAKNVYLRQSVSATGGQNYRISFDSRGDLGARLSIRITARLGDGTDRYLDSTLQWATAVEHLYFQNMAWTTHDIDLPSTPDTTTSLTVYLFHARDMESSVWVDKVVLKLRDPGTPRIWQGYFEDLKSSWGALKNGERLISPHSSLRLDPMVLNDGEFHAPSGQYYFYYRNDSGMPGTMEIGYRHHGILVDGASYVDISNVDVIGPTGIRPEDVVSPSGYNTVRVTGADHITLQDMEISHSYGVGVTFSDGTSNSTYRRVHSHDHANTCMYISSAGTGNSAFDCEAHDCGVLSTDTGDMGIIGVWDTTDAHIENCHVYNNGFPGAEKLDAAISVVKSPGAVVTRNRVHDVGGIGIQVAESSNASEISYNIVERWAGHGVVGSTGPYDPVNPATYAEGIRLGGAAKGCSGCIVFNNLLIGGQTAGEWGAIAFANGTADAKADYSNTQIKNNIFHDNEGIYEVKVMQNTIMTGVDFSNNIYHRTSGNAIKWTDSGNIVHLYDAWHILGNTAGYYSYDLGQEAGSIAADPLLASVDPAMADYHLTVASPAVDAGASGLGSVQDIEYNPVVGEPDIGPYELQDRDADGYIAAQDCNDLDAGIHPGVLEISRDGIDQDCQGGDATITATATYSINRKGQGRLTIQARVDGGQSDQLIVETYGAMTWQKRQGAWTLKVDNVSANPGVVRITGSEGTVEVVVAVN